MARSFGSPIPRTPFPNLRLNRGLLANLARPRFSTSVGTAVGQAILGPEVREKKAEQDRLFGEIMQASKDNDMAKVGNLFQEYGRLNKNLSTIPVGSSVTPHQCPLTKTFDIDANTPGAQSSINFISTFSLNQSIISFLEYP